LSDPNVDAGAPPPLQQQNLLHERSKRAAAAFDERVVFEAFDTSDRATFLERGIWDSLSIEGKEVRNRPTRR